MDIEKLLEEMVRRKASDIYITTGVPVTYRIEDDLTVSDKYKEPLGREQIQELAFSLMSDRQKEAFVRERELNSALSYPGLGRFRVNMCYQRSSIGLVIRHVKHRVMSFTELGLPPILGDISMSRRGLVLVVGTAGSGKSTTLAAMVDYRASNASGHIVTVEDPIEFLYTHKRSIVTQREVGTDTHSYGDALRNAFRQAPDVILIGEIRDTETMEAALSFAETGHLCMSTLHANNANQAIERILTFFPAAMHEQVYVLLSLNLRAIVSQRIVPTTTGGSRVAAMEILLDTPRVKDLIHKREVELLKETMAKGNQEGMFTFDQSLFELFKGGQISYETALSHADGMSDLRLRIKTEGLMKESKGTRKSSFKLKTT
ncbi:MAG: PilT/PilU family type 4a pilus ATPase [Candidatus Brocadiales bacterium]|nr:PilT/PilU family type 4a pilus ATPase [Candidatus Bathyanammoxibius amoris]